MVSNIAADTAGEGLFAKTQFSPGDLVAIYNGEHGNNLIYDAPCINLSWKQTFAKFTVARCTPLSQHTTGAVQGTQDMSPALKRDGPQPC